MDLLLVIINDVPCRAYCLMYQWRSRGWNNMIHRLSRHHVPLDSWLKNLWLICCIFIEHGTSTSHHIYWIGIFLSVGFLLDWFHCHSCSAVCTVNCELWLIVYPLPFESYFSCWTFIISSLLTLEGHIALIRSQKTPVISDKALCMISEMITGSFRAKGSETYKMAHFCDLKNALYKIFCIFFFYWNSIIFFVLG